MDPRSIEYLNSRVRSDSTEPVLRSLAAELEQQAPSTQLRSLAYLAGRRLAAQRTIGDLKVLADFEGFANTTFSGLDWGWVRIEEAAGAIDILHGCTPLRRWFGEAGMSWAPGFFEGLYAEWMRQLGAGERLDVREIVTAGASSDILRFRLAHESSFA